MALNSEGQLVILSPLNEPSGAPFFKNYAPLAFSYPSGISLDWNVEITNANTNEPQAVWPGSKSVFMPTSGTTHTGYAVQGTANTNAAANQTATEKCLVLGQGGFAAQNILGIPAVAMSGFTIGYWVSPQSDGFTTTNSTGKQLGQRHALIAKGNNTDALYLGVSGSMAQAAQFSQDIYGSGLAAFAVVSNATVANERRLSTPIESGVFTHITFTYRHDPAGGTAHQIALFKNGRLAASGTTSTALDRSNTAWTGRPITIGGSWAATVTNRFLDASGWGHLVSGVYAYERVLNDGEVLQLHNQGGLQVPSNLTYPLYQPVQLSDRSIVTYCPFVSPGFIDVSRHHLNPQNNEDEGKNGDYIICPGPFNRAMAFNNTAVGVNRAIGTLSGTINQILYRGNGSFTMAGWFFLANIAQVGSSFDQTTLISYGSAGTTNEFNPTRQTGGFQVSASGNTNSVRISARFYDGGLVTLANTTVLTHNDNNPLLSVAQHVAIVYDAQTVGAALYVNGNLAQSGTLPSAITPLMERLAFSGFPVMFLGDVIADTPDSYSNLGGDACAISELFIANRPLLPAEVRFIAESGIDITPTYYSVQDPRLRGYWPCTDSNLTDLLIPDHCMIFSSGGIAGHLTRVISDDMWTILESSENKGQQFSIDMFSATRDPVLGITSGTFVVMGGSDGTDHVPSTTGEHSRTSSTDFCKRYRMYQDQRTVRAPAFINEYIFLFDVTPSGTIAPVTGASGKDFNSTLFYFGEPSATDHITGYLSSVGAANGSGITLFIQTQDAAVIQPLVSGNLSYGVTSRCMFHAKPLLPFNASTTTPIQCTLWVNGAEVNNFVYDNATAMLYDSDAIGVNDNWQLQIGGRAASDTSTTHSAILDGLGGIYMKNIAVLVGLFSNNDLSFLANSGIQSNSNITNYKDTLNVSPVYISDTRLVGYWRFSGPDSGSGITDQSINHNDLTHLARQALGSPTFVNNAANVANLLRFVPGPFQNSALQIQGSGLTFKGRLPPSNVNTIAPFAFSGVAAQIPQSGFSVGFWIAPRASQATDSAVVLSYGVTSATIGASNYLDASWAVLVDDDNDFTLILSQDGTMTLSNTSEVKKSSQTKCRISQTLNVETSSCLETFRQGQWKTGHIDAFKHIAFTYQHSGDPTISGICRGYYNGERVTEAYVPASGFHQPDVVETRMISFMIPMTSIWGWNASRGATDPVIFDVFYASAPLGDEEVRYISQFGIAAPPSTTSSGIIGGYASGIQGVTSYIGGFVDGKDTGSGIMGGYCVGSKQSSGIIGGYVQGTAATSSGVMGGFVTGASSDFSGVMGGFCIGATPTSRYFDMAFVVEFFATSDFDAQLKVQKTQNSDFDAQILVYQEERCPDVAIIIPNATVSGTAPWNQYFIGSGRALQNKTLVQAKWYFNDFTMPVLATPSGNDLFPISHQFGQSGIYIVRFSVIDSNGIHNSATRIIDLSSGVAPVQLALSGTPETGFGPLIVDFTQNIVSIPPNVIILANLLTLDDGQDSIITNIRHTYTETGCYNPIWIVKDSRGLIWGDSLEIGVDN